MYVRQYRAILSAMEQKEIGQLEGQTNFDILLTPA